MTVAYLDTSAIVKLCVREDETETLRADVARHDRLVTGLIAETELRRALHRRQVPHAEAVAASTLAALDVVAFDVGLARDAGRLEEPRLRSLDAIHVASALALGDALDAFYAYDLRLADAARAHGLVVVAPA